MKTLLILKTVILLVILTFGFTASAQEFTKTSSTKALEFSGESKTAEVALRVSDQIDVLLIKIENVYIK